jgi:predicted ABC-type transport system involved in lysophospholipase L1 biosynthesis ATPase subunit
VFAAFQLVLDVREVGQGATAAVSLFAGGRLVVRIQSRLQFGVGHRLWQWPAQSGGGEAGQIIVDRALAAVDGSADLPLAELLFEMEA